MPSSIVEVINGIDDSSVLKAIFRRAITIDSVEELQQFLEEIVSQEE